MTASDEGFRFTAQAQSLRVGCTAVKIIISRIMKLDHHTFLGLFPSPRASYHLSMRLWSRLEPAYRYRVLLSVRPYSVKSGARVRVFLLLVFRGFLRHAGAQGFHLTASSRHPRGRIRNLIVPYSDIRH